jgi:hypothetical protein
VSDVSIPLLRKYAESLTVIALSEQQSSSIDGADRIIFVAPPGKGS